MKQVCNSFSLILSSVLIGTQWAKDIFGKPLNASKKKWLILTAAFLTACIFSFLQAQTITGATSICGGSSTTLHASGSSPMRWYDAPSGGNLLHVGNTFNTPNLSSNSSFWVSANGGARRQVNISVSDLTIDNLLANPSDVCVSETTSALSGEVTGGLINWYDAPTAGTLLGASPSGDGFPVSPSTTTTYYATSEVQTRTQTFNYTGNVQTFTVPDGVTNISVIAYGAKGGHSDGSNSGLNYGGYEGGFGGKVQGTMNVTPGQVLNIYVGGAGKGDPKCWPCNTPAPGWNGGGAVTYSSSNATGGGATDIRVGGTSLNDRVLVAGGGGGGALSGTGGNGGYNGGVGNIYPSYGRSVVAENRGKGGTQTSGGLKGCWTGWYTQTCAFDGQFGIGGTGTHSGGWYGGGGGGGWYGGGGGSSYADHTIVQNVSYASGVQNGHGQLVISYYSNCSNPVREPVMVNVHDEPTTANAGSDQTILYVNAATLAANSPTIGTGKWSVRTGSASFSNLNDPNTTITSMHPGDNIYRWTISNGPCDDSFDEMTINFTPCVEPTITCPQNMVISSSTGQCGALATYPVFSTGTPGPDLSYVFTGATTASGAGTGDFSFFNVGQTLVSIQADNDCVLPATCSFTIEVIDIEKPNITCAANQTHSTDLGECFAMVNVLPPTSSDNCDVQGISNSITLSEVASGAYPVGTTSILWTVTDVNGLTNTCEQFITVSDDEKPKANCQPHTVQLDADGNGSLTAADVNDSSSDACGIASLSASPNSFDCTNVGLNTVTLTVTDVNGNVNTCTSTVTVEDNILPQAVCQPHTVQLDADGNGSLTVNDIDDASSDACGVASTSASKTSFNCTNLGLNTVTLTVTDVNENVNTCTSTVTVEDNILPQAVCQLHTLTLDADGIVEITPNDVDDGSSDACTLSLSVSQTSFDCTHIGSNTVNLTASDESGNSSNCTATVTVLAGPYFTWYKDTDNDGYSNGDLIEACEAPSNYQLVFDLTQTSGDCNDYDPFVHPDRIEVCNGIDDDCDGNVDENTLTEISVSNLTSCDDNGTTDPSDDFFTADVTVLFTDIPTIGDLLLSGDGNASVPVAELSGGQHTFLSVEMPADGSAISLTSGFNITQCNLTNENLGTAPSYCSPCEIFDITFANANGCNPNGNTDPLDDTFTADVTVTFDAPPTSGTLDLSGDGTASVAVSNLSGSSHTFMGVSLPANGGSISLSANFSAGACGLTIANAGTALEPCCFTEITGLEITPETCAGMSNGNLEIFAEGTGTLQYSIDGGASFGFTNVFENLSEGNFEIVVMVQGQGCSDASQASLPTPSGSLQTWFKDMDADGYTDGMTMTNCSQPMGYVLSALPGDCNDFDPTQYPGQIWYEDLDGDGYGTGNPLVSCSRPFGCYTASELSAAAGDCDDDDENVHPGATEICNGIDDDCDGEVDEGTTGGLTFNGDVTFSNQAEVDDFSACYSIVNGNLYIKNAGVTGLSNLMNLTQVTGFVYIKSTSLTSLAGLDNLTTVGSYLRVMYNNSLTTLDGLDAVTSVGSYLRVYRNNNLTDCCAIHDLLANGGVGGSISISRNDTGCDSVSEIETACAGGNNFIAPPASDLFASTDAEAFGMNVFPNPNGGIFQVKITGGLEGANLRMLDATGQVKWMKEVTEGDGTYPVKMGRLVTGIYFLQYTDGENSWTEKVIVR